MDSKSRKTSIYMNEILRELLEKYAPRIGDGGQTETITAIMDRYDAVVSTARRGLRTYFLQEEINLMLNNALSTRYEPGAIIPGAVLADTEDEIDSQFEYFSVDRGKLIEKLKVLGLASQFALVDWLEELKSKA